MIKIAVASDIDTVAGHFGKCINFNVFEVVNNEIVKSESFDSPEHKPGIPPNFLNDLGVNVVISGGMGGGAMNIFNSKDIEVVIGANGDAKEAVEAYLQGLLKSTGSVCAGHGDGDDGCGK